MSSEKREHYIGDDAIAYIIAFALVAFGLNQCNQCQQVREQMKATERTDHAQREPNA